MELHSRVGDALAVGAAILFIIIGLWVVCGRDGDKVAGAILVFVGVAMLFYRHLVNN